MLKTVENEVAEEVDETIDTIVGLLQEFTDPRGTYGLTSGMIAGLNTFMFIN
jgi:hypothetical protein